MLAFIVAAAAFAPLHPAALPTNVQSRGSPAVMGMSGRRAALLSGAALAATTLPAWADSIEDIAARNAAKAEEARVKAASTATKTAEEEEAEKSKSFTLIGGVLVGSVALSVPFYLYARAPGPPVLPSRASDASGVVA